MKLKKTINLIILITAFSQTLSMEIIWYNPNVKNDIHVQLAQRYFSYDSICALALVNKQWNNFIIQTANVRQKFLADYEEYRKDCMYWNFDKNMQTTWHKHKSAYAYWIRSPKHCSVGNEQLILYLVYSDGNNNINYRTHHFPHHHLSVESLEKITHKPAFNNRGEALFNLSHYWTSNSNLNAAYVLSTKKLSK